MCMHVYVCLMGMENSREGWDTKEVLSSVSPPLQIMLVLLSCLEMGRCGVCAQRLWGKHNLTGINHQLSRDEGR